MNRQTHKALLSESAKSDIVLGIDIIAKEGLDIPDRNTLVWSTPPGIEIEQPAGRILRKYHKDINPMIIDIVDHTGNFPNHSRERDKWFIEEDYIIHDHTVELFDDVNLWKDHVTDYLHKMKMATLVRRKKAKIEQDKEDEAKGPDMTQCFLIQPDDPVKVKGEGKSQGKSQGKSKGKSQSQGKSQGQSLETPNQAFCYLAYASKSPEEEKAKTVPDISSCLI
jgi:superfamily II DNA or RNA helicase